MKRFMKIAVMMIAALMLISVAACTKTPAEPETGTQEDVSGTATEGEEEEPNPEETVIMATNAEFPPFEFITNNGLVDTYDGIDVAIGLEIANALGKQLKVENMEFEAVLAAVPTGNADFAAAGMSITEERKQSMDFSDTYFNATQYIIVKSGNEDIKSAADFKDKTVGVVAGYTGEKVCLTIEIDTLESFKKGVDAISALKSNLIDAVVIDSHTAIAMVAKNPELVIIEDPTVFESEEYAIAVKKGNTELLDVINGVIADLKANGKIDELTAQYTDLEE